MESTIYILGVTFQHRKMESIPFSKFLSRNLHLVMPDHAPHDTGLKSISWHQDDLIISLVDQLVRNAEGFPEIMGLTILEPGYFKITLENQDSLVYRELQWLEWIIQRLHENYEFLGSYFFYLVEEDGELTLKHFSMLSTPSVFDEGEAEDFPESTPQVATMLSEHLYQKELSDSSASMAAKILLTRRHL